MRRMYHMNGRGENKPLLIMLTGRKFKFRKYVDDDWKDVIIKNGFLCEIRVCSALLYI